MVHEINPSGSEKDEGIVNSTSLEDVALSEVCNGVINLFTGIQTT